MEKLDAPGAEETADPGAAPPAKGRPPTAGQPWTPYAFMAPYLVLFGLFVVAPAVYGVWISLHAWDFMMWDQPFVGLDNYARLFQGDSLTGSFFWLSMGATAKFILYSVPPLLVVPFAIALVLNQPFRGRTFFRAVFFAPFVLGVAVVGILWRFLADTNVGAINYILGLVGLPDDIAWVTSLPPGWVLLVVMTVWWTLGFNAVIYLAGLQEIPRELYEAAAVDGASAWRKFLHITLPGIRRVLFFVVTITILASANMFGQSFLVTQGSPSNRTRTAIMYIAEEGLGAGRMGGAAAMSYLLTLFLIAISVSMYFGFRRWMED